MHPDTLPRRPRILLVDPDPFALAQLSDALVREGYVVDRSDCGEAVERLRNNGAAPDAVLLEREPEAGGMVAARRLRAADPGVPVLMVSSADAVATQVAALDAGVDDFLVRPYALPVLLARVRALLRRAQARRGPGGERLAYADLELCATDHQASRGGEPLLLTRTEFALLELFMRHPEKVLSRSFIVEHVWGFAVQFSSNSLGVYIGQLRRKTEARGEPRLIQTVWGVGYVLRADG
jgi:two-component system response regulator MprA